ncbi:MAG: hemerythrin domain-containing protein [Bacteroidaceae bacterium]|nr:hemerythrin domain-containing protein [Bacteroidaceae bacterium]
MTHKDLFASNGKTLLADLIEQNFPLINIVGRLGMDLRMGRYTVAEVCDKAGVDLETFMLICKIYTYDDFVPTDNLLDKVSVKDIVKYLHASHQYYAGTALVQLEESIENLLRPCSEKQKSAIWKFYSEYSDEVRRHFSYEEEQLFPYLDMLCCGKENNGYSISQFEEHHSNVDEKLADLKNLIMRYLPEECDNNLCMQTISLIFHLETDLLHHTRIEDEILVAVVNRIEKNGRK